MSYVIDESSYRVDKTNYPTSEEAEQRASEAARILGRAVNVYELAAGELHFAFRVMPDGSTQKENPLTDTEPGSQVEPAGPVVMGSLEQALADLDEAAEKVEQQGNLELATEIDRAAQHARETGNVSGAAVLAAKLKAEIAAK